MTYITVISYIKQSISYKTLISFKTLISYKTLIQLNLYRAACECFQLATAEEVNVLVPGLFEFGSVPCFDQRHDGDDCRHCAAHRVAAEDEVPFLVVLFIKNLHQRKLFRSAVESFVKSTAVLAAGKVGPHVLLPIRA